MMPGMDSLTGIRIFSIKARIHAKKNPPYGGFVLAGDEGFDLPLAGPKLHLSKLVLKSRFPCELPPAILTPIFLVGGFESIIHKKGYYITKKVT